MKKTNLQNNQQLWNRAIHALSMTTLLVGMILANSSSASAQFTFMGDYDKTFAAPLGYYIDPQNPVAPATDTNDTHFYTGELLPDGSIIAGGRHSNTALRGDFYLRKFTASGAVDTSFGTNGFVRTNFHTRSDGVDGNDLPQILKVQPDGKIVFAGQCYVFGSVVEFGQDACIVRYNANGTLDSSFGGFPVSVSNGPNQTFQVPIDLGKVIFQTGIRANGLFGGTDGVYYDMAIQPDGKIVLVGETRNFASNGAPQGLGAIVVRLNPNGSLDSTFGNGGIARWTAPEGPASCFPPRRFSAVRLQPDGRIVAVGFNSVSLCSGTLATGNRFVVTRWTSGGQLETVRHLDNNTTFDSQDERAVAVHLTRDASKILVSGSFRNLSGTPAGRQKQTLVRLNIGDLSLDTSFGSGGIAQYNTASNNSGGSTLYVKAIQPDDRFIGTDQTFLNGNVVRLNPDGSGDQSFGNESIDGSTTLPRGRLRVMIPHRGFNIAIEAGHILVRPNGRINLIGRVGDFTFGFGRAVVSQQNTVFENGVYSDFTNDGKSEIAVFRDGNWYYLNSANNQFSGLQFGQAGDKPVPADYDGDGKTDVAVFRGGFWYILQSSNNQFRGLQFGSTGDLPLPGDFDGDGLADISVFRPSNGGWYRLNSSNNQFVGLAFGQNGDIPLLADFDGDGKSDIAVFRGGFWYYLQSSDGQFRGLQFGLSTDIPIVGDYDGDGKSDISVFRDGTWYRLNSSTGAFVGVQWGQSGDKPVAADYDNDGKTDLAVFRGGYWYVLNSATNSFSGTFFGFSTDIPIPMAYLP